MPHNTSWDTHIAPDNEQPLQQQQHPSSDNIHTAGRCPCVSSGSSHQGNFRRRQSQQSQLAKFVMTSQTNSQDATRSKGGDENAAAAPAAAAGNEKDVDKLRNQLDKTLSMNGGAQQNEANGISGHQFEPADFKLPPAKAVGSSRGSLAAAMSGQIPEFAGATMAANDTPATTAPSSPHISGQHSSRSSEGSSEHIRMPPPKLPSRQNSGTNTPRVRPTTLDIPGLTKSKVSPDGKIAQRDVGAKLVIVMVGLPARGKSYITKKLARYLNWLQHDTRIFNVGERRRVVALGPGAPGLEKVPSRHAREMRGFTVSDIHPPNLGGPSDAAEKAPKSANAAQILLNDEKVEPPATPPSSSTPTAPSEPKNGDDEEEEEEEDLNKPDMGEPCSPRISRAEPSTENDMEQNANFFDPANEKASQIREQVARETLDELLDFVLDQNGSVGILDATNSTSERRKMVMDRIRERAPDLNVLFLESRCVDQDLLEANMRLKLSGPDYKEMDPVVALEDFKKRVHVYEKAYVPLGEHEEKHHMPYIQMIDVGRKIISHQIKGFLMAQANYYLLNFNLAPRQIWITRHGLSKDNISGKIGGDSDLAPEGQQYARDLARFMETKRREWDEKQLHALRNSHFPPRPGDVTPPNPHYVPPQSGPPNITPPPTSPPPAPAPASDPLPPGYEPKNFCVWTSMLRRSIQTASHFNDEDYEIKQMRMLDELNAGVMEGLTYSCISTQYPAEYASRKGDKLHYRYPGPGGEGYLDIINRLRPVIVELERMTDHVLLVGHRSVARVLLAYFRGLRREEVADLDVPLGMLYCLEPKPYGVDFQAYRWVRGEGGEGGFEVVPGFQLQRDCDDMT